MNAPHPLAPHYRTEALREIRAANAPKLFAIAERVREAMADAKRETRPVGAKLSEEHK